MLYLLFNHYRDALDRAGLAALVRLFVNYIEFRAIFSTLLSFAIVIRLGPGVIRWLTAKKVGDNPEFYNQKLNQLTSDKKNVPTMGGILIVGSILACIFLLADLTNFYIIMAVICTLWLGAMGAADDWLKLTSARRQPGSREGLFFHEKLLLQLGLAVVLGLFIHHHGSTKLDLALDTLHFNKMSHALTLPFMKTWQRAGEVWMPADHLIVLSAWQFVLLSILVIAGSSNAVNLTDGMDGLASGIMSIVAFAFLILALIAGYSEWSRYLLVPYIPLSDELAIVAGAMLGACIGFLWFNCHPAQVFMGDTGSLALGGLIGYIAVVIRQEFLLLIIGGIFVAEALSVMIQVFYFKSTGGKRIFRCAPLHHHFHLGGWTENKVVIRFWIISIILAALALATIKLR